MNRIPTSQELVDETVDSTCRPRAVARFSLATRHAAYALFGPLHYEPNYAYPLVVWLHGAGESEEQLRRIMPALSMRNYVGVAPRGSRATTVRRLARGYSWPHTAADVALAQQRVQAAIADACGQFHVAPQRVFIGGADCGGTVAYRIALQQPQRFAGVFSLGGAFPCGGAPLCYLPEARRLKVFIGCGRESSTYEEPAVCRDLRLLFSAGMDVSLRQYPGRNGISPDMLADLNRWLMEQVTQAPRA
jgi:phospholipase/carboxylesterase